MSRFVRQLRRRFTRAEMNDQSDDRLRFILHSPAIRTEPVGQDRRPQSPIGVHILGQDAHLIQALWTLKSFYHFADVCFPLTVHLQGTNTRQMLASLPDHFPDARLISQESADAIVEPWLQERGFQRLLAMRRQFFLMMKLIDLHVFARTSLVLYLDTDVLFFRRPRELVDPPGKLSTAFHLFMRDDYPSYCISPQQAGADLEVDLIPFANTGIMRLVPAAIDLEACEQFMAHPMLSKQHWHLEQTLHALNASAQGRLRLLPETYAISTGLQANPYLVARHYASPIRPLLAEEGVAHLMTDGFLEALEKRADALSGSGRSSE